MVGKRKYSMLLRVYFHLFNGKLPEATYILKKLENATSGRMFSATHISLDKRKTLCGLDIFKSNKQNRNNWEETKDKSRICKNCLRIYTILKREMNKPCKGRLYRFENRTEVTKKGDIIEKRVFRFLRVASCLGCDDCKAIADKDPSEYIYPQQPIEGQIYKACKDSSCDVDNSDFQVVFTPVNQKDLE